MKKNYVAWPIRDVSDRRRATDHLPGSSMVDPAHSTGSQLVWSGSILARSNPVPARLHLARSGGLSRSIFLGLAADPCPWDGTADRQKVSAITSACVTALRCSTSRPTVRRWIGT